MGTFWGFTRSGDGCFLGNEKGTFPGVERCLVGLVFEV
jgi:hypothetical protein